nr:hypothetical protein [Vibrio splendidus]MCC4881463.1 hypothetical protein [Vibrio splendidus]
MSTKKLDRVLDENLVNLGFLLGLGASVFSPDDKKIIRTCLYYKNEKTKHKYQDALISYSSVDACDDIITTFSYWIEKDLESSRVKGLVSNSELKLSDAVRMRLEVRYRARLRKEFRGLAKTARLFRRLILLICLRLTSNEITDEGRIIEHVKKLSILASSCNYKLISGLLLMELNQDSQEERLAVVYICFLSYMSESIGLINECVKYVESNELNREIINYKEHLSSRLKSFMEQIVKKCDIQPKSAVKSALLNVDNKALVSEDWVDLKQNIEACRSILAVLSSKKALLQGK